MANRVFLHIGAPKSGTTFLQQVLGGNRTRLAERGVLYASGRYAGDRVWATEVLRGLDHSTHPNPDAGGAWDRILGQVRAWDRTAVVSHEFFSACGAAQARRALADLAPAEVHVVVTARDYVRQVAAAWQERLKFRHTTPLGKFSLDDVHGTPLWSWRTQDIGAVLDRWGQDLPPDRVHVVTVPSPGGPQGVLWDRFAGVIGIDPASCDVSKARANTSLGAAEAELLRRVNEHLGGEIRNPREAARWVRDVLAHRILVPRQGDRFGLSPDAAGMLRERSLATVEQLRARGYDIVGDLAELIPPDDLPAVRHPDDVPDAELLEAATDTIARMLREIKQQTLRAERAEQAARSGNRPRGGQPAPAGIGHPPGPRSTRQRLIDLSEKYGLVMKARVGYVRARDVVRKRQRP